MQRIALWLTPLIAISVVVFLILFFIRINKNEYISSEVKLTIPDVTLDLPRENSSHWLEHFSKSEKLGSYFPVTEIDVSLSLEKAIIKRQVYKLSANVMDPYQLFCLKQELKQRGIHYFFKRDKQISELLVFSKNRVKLDALVIALKDYKIKANLTPYKEDEQWKNSKL